MTGPEITVQLGSWDELKDEAAPIRFAVFVDEQHVPPETELDEWDALSLHAIARAADGTALGTGRLLPDGHIGRMAVTQAARGLGVGAVLLSTLMAEARRRGCGEVALSAQTHALGFYGKHGFVAEGDEYLDCEIPHRLMRHVFD
ncbi:MAG: GNAT family N-acetyltransferase [Burkholderiaceae bacterium]